MEDYASLSSRIASALCGTRIRHRFYALLVFLVVGSIAIQTVSHRLAVRSAVQSEALANLEVSTASVSTWLRHNIELQEATAKNLSTWRISQLTTAATPEFVSVAKVHDAGLLNITDRTTGKCLVSSGEQVSLSPYLLKATSGYTIAKISSQPNIVAWAALVENKRLCVITAKPLSAIYDKNIGTITKDPTLALVVGNVPVLPVASHHDLITEMISADLSVNPKRSLVELLHEGHRYLVGSRSLYLSGNGRVTVMVATDTDKIKSWIDYRSFISLVLWLGMLCAVVLGSLGIFRMVLTPIEALSHGVREVRGGNLDVRVPVRSDNELGQLSRAFNDMVASVAASQAKLTDMANLDPVTQFFNHRRLQESLEEMIERAQLKGELLNIIMIDIDDFKSINTTFGHEIGDVVLKQCADTIAGFLREEDCVGRYGGEEFVIILPNTDTKASEEMADSIRGEIARRVFGDKTRGSILITVSCGVATWPTHSGGRYGLVLAADTALRHAKREGKNRTAVFDALMAKEYVTPSSHLEVLLHDASLSAIEALAATVDARDSYTLGHSESVMRYSLLLADAVELDGADREILRISALLHDIGKIGVPDNVLKKPGPLSASERKEINVHPKIGAGILERIPRLITVANATRHHHERYDGSGYPDGLKGEDIPIFARIISIADSYDAMVSDRPYRHRCSAEEALREIERCAGTQFDPVLAQRFVEMVKDSDNSSMGNAA